MHTRFLAALAVTGALLAPTPAEASQPTWSYLNLPAGTENGWASAINNRGQIAGILTSRDAAGDLVLKPVRWENADATPTPLPLPQGSRMDEVTGINEAGVVVGHALGADGNYDALSWDAEGRLHPLAPNTTARSTAYSVNAKGEVAGQVGDVPVVFRGDGSYTAVPGVPKGIAKGIADDGGTSTVVGTAARSPHSVFEYGSILSSATASLLTGTGEHVFTQAVSGDGLTILAKVSATERIVLFKQRMLPPPSLRWAWQRQTIPQPTITVDGTTFTAESNYATAINRAGSVIVGYVWFAPSSLPDATGNRPYRYRNGTVEYLAGTDGSAHAVNDFAATVGQVRKPGTNAYVPIIWR